MEQSNLGSIQLRYFILGGHLIWANFTRTLYSGVDLTAADLVDGQIDYDSLKNRSKKQNNLGANLTKVFYL